MNTFHLRRSLARKLREESKTVKLGRKVKGERRAAKAAYQCGNLDYCGVFG